MKEFVFYLWVREYTCFLNGIFKKRFVRMEVCRLRFINLVILLRCLVKVIVNIVECLVWRVMFLLLRKCLVIGVFVFIKGEMRY